MGAAKHAKRAGVGSLHNETKKRGEKHRHCSSSYLIELNTPCASMTEGNNRAAAEPRLKGEKERKREKEQA